MAIEIDLQVRGNGGGVLTVRWRDATGSVADGFAAVAALLRQLEACGDPPPHATAAVAASAQAA